MKINMKVRSINWAFWLDIALAVITPILAYFGIAGADLTSWPVVGSYLFEAVKNPYVLALVGVSVWNALNDPTTPGIKDSKRALGYSVPGGAPAEQNPAD